MTFNIISLEKMTMGTLVKMGASPRAEERRRRRSTERRRGRRERSPTTRRERPLERREAKTGRE